LTESPPTPPLAQPPGDLAAELPDEVSVRHWFAAYAGMVLAAAAALVVLSLREQWSWGAWRDDFWGALHEASPAAKLIVFGIYISLCCTFLPLPTGAIVAAVATRQANIAPDVWTVTLLVALVGGLASTVANLNDYHLFTLLLRHHRIGRVRQMRLYLAAARWFGRAPFFLLVVFNILPIPVDVVRMLATTYRYGRGPFAAANFVGRFIRYGVIAFVTYWWNLGWIAVLVLLGLAVVLGAAKVLPPLARRLLRPAANQPTP